MKYAVAFMNYFDNELTVDVVEADGVREAISEHRAVPKEDPDWLASLPDDLESIQEEFFNCDLAVDVVELPDEEHTYQKGYADGSQDQHAQALIVLDEFEADCGCKFSLIPRLSKRFNETR